MFPKKYFDADTGGAGGAGATGDQQQTGDQQGATGGAGDQQQQQQAVFGTDFKNPEVKNWVTSKGFKDAESVAESARNLEKLTGDLNSIVKLPKERTPETMMAVYDKLGRPAEPSGYEITVPEGIGDQGFADRAKAAFHKAGVPADLAKSIADWWNKDVTEQLTAAQTKTAETHAAEVNALKTEWGANFQSNSALADRAGETFGMTNEDYAALKTAMGPAKAMKFLHTIGSKIGVEARGDFSGEHQGFSNITPEQAKAEISALRADREFAKQFASPDPTVKKAAKDKMDRLHKIAYPGMTVV